MAKKIAVMTSGGDAPGMNAFIRAAVRHSLTLDYQAYGIYEGYSGLINGLIEELDYDSVCNIIQKGGTILKTSRSKEFLTVEGREQAAANLEKHGIDALICCGGNGSYRGLKEFSEQWSGQLIGTPGTIDNDVEGTEYTIGYDTAINTAMEAIDKLRDTGDSHNMDFIVEVMGRHCGDLAKSVGIASGATDILIPETATDVNEVIRHMRDIGHNIVVVAEGDESGGAVKLAKKLKTRIQEQGDEEIDFRICILGHTQRGGRPTARDRIIASNMAVYAVECIKDGENLKSVCYRDSKLCLSEL